MTKDTMTVTPEMTVNEIIAAHAETVPIFGAWGVDSCCGGALPVATVAEKHGFDLDRLLGDLNGAAAGSLTIPLQG